MTLLRPHLPSVDQWLIAADVSLKTLSGTIQASRPYPAHPEVADTMSTIDKRLSGALMRVNHVGEVCAQALYTAQSLTAGDASLRAHFDAAAREEGDHLAWTQQRLRELSARPSVLNPLWYAGAFVIGGLAGRSSDAISLGFVVETERQVEHHLALHLQRLPASDETSRAIVAQMKDDEARHGAAAMSAGASLLPWPVRWLMQAAARVMTATAHYL